MPHATAPQRRFLDRRVASPTLISAGTRFEGAVTCRGDLSVAGEVIGPGQLDGMLTLAASGDWRGTVSCTQALLAGRFEGELTVTGKLEIRSTARISGRLTAQHIAIAEGAHVAASLQVLSGSDVQHFTEKHTQTVP